MSDKDTLWEAIEEQPYMADPDDARATRTYERSWEYLSKLREGGALRQIDLMQLKELLDAVYERGVHEGASNPYC